MSGIAGQLGVPASALPALAVLLVVQLTLLVYSLADLVRRPASQVTMNKKWVWALVIVFVNVVGPVVYLAAGRKTAPVADPLRAADSAGHGAARDIEASDEDDRAAGAVDVLYGSEDDR